MSLTLQSDREDSPDPKDKGGTVKPESLQRGSPDPPEVECGDCLSDLFSYSDPPAFCPSCPASRTQTKLFWILPNGA